MRSPFLKKIINPSCTKVFGTHGHTIYEGGGGGCRLKPPYDNKNGRVHKLQHWQAMPLRLSMGSEHD